MSNFKIAFEQAKSAAAASLAKAGKDETCSFTEGYTDPWLEWLANKVPDPGSRCEKIIVLQDWGADFDQDNQDLESSLSKEESETELKEDDKTLVVLKKVFGVRAIRDGRVIIFNAVWANRAKGIPKSGELSMKIHYAAFPIWASIVKSLCPTKEAKVFLCGSWAKWPETAWGHEVRGDEEILRWKKCAKVKETQPNPKDFSHLKFCTITHPSAWTFRFEKYFPLPALSGQCL